MAETKPESAKTAWKRRRREAGECECCGNRREDPADLRMCIGCRERDRNRNRVRMALSRAGKKPLPDARRTVEVKPNLSVEYLPTNTRPGTPEHVAVLSYRAENGLPLRHPKDGQDLS